MILKSVMIFFLTPCLCRDQGEKARLEISDLKRELSLSQREQERISKDLEDAQEATQVDVKSILASKVSLCVVCSKCKY